jgi:hypothetical protein
MAPRGRVFSVNWANSLRTFCRAAADVSRADLISRIVILSINSPQDTGTWGVATLGAVLSSDILFVHFGEKQSGHGRNSDAAPRDLDI